MVKGLASLNSAGEQAGWTHVRGDIGSKGWTLGQTFSVAF